MTHPQEEQLETYALGRVPDVELAGIEEHLLICGLCLDWVQAQEQMVRVLCDCLLRPVPKRSRRLRATLSSEGWLF